MGQKEIDERAAEKERKEKEKAELKEKAEQQLAAKKAEEEAEKAKAEAEAAAAEAAAASAEPVEEEKVVEVPMIDAKESEEGPLQGPEVPPSDTITTKSGEGQPQVEHLGEN